MIRVCAQAEALDVLNEPQTVERLGLVSESLIFQPWIVEDGEHKLMFVFWVLDSGECEMHIACPKKSVIKSRLLTSKAVDFVFSCGVDRITTNCPLGKISNMAFKLGFKEVKREDKQIYLEVNYGDWCSNRG